MAASVLAPPPLEAAPEAGLPLEVVYEDEHLLVVNKVGAGGGEGGVGGAAAHGGQQGGCRAWGHVLCVQSVGVTLTWGAAWRRH